MTTLLRQNSELRSSRIWNWSLPAATTTLPDGRHINVCPAADACVRLCYARVNSYRFSTVVAAHQRNLIYVLDELDLWEVEMTKELLSKRFRPSGEPRSDLLHPFLDPYLRQWAADGGVAVRIHDAGDFFSDPYTSAWLRIAARTPDVLFYAYTKEVSRFREIVEPVAPPNFRWLFSYGGKQDHLIDPIRDRHADVFPTLEALTAAGYTDQASSDLLAVTAPTNLIGIVANNVPQLRRRQGDSTFRDTQAQRKVRVTE